MRKNILIFMMILSPLYFWGQHPTDNMDVRKVFPFHNTDVTLKNSWLKQREELNITFLKSLDPDRLLHNFRITAKLPSDAIPLEGWESP